MAFPAAAVVAWWLEQAAIGAAALGGPIAVKKGWNYYFRRMEENAARKKKFHEHIPKPSNVRAVKNTVSSVMDSFDEKFQARVINYVTSFFNSTRSPYTMMVLTTIAVIRILVGKEIVIGSSKLILKLADEVLNAAKNVTGQGSKGFYYMMKKFAELCEVIWENGGRPLLMRALRYASGYYNVIENPQKAKDIAPILRDLEKAENRATAVANKVTNVQANGVDELQLKLKMKLQEAKHQKLISTINSKTPGNLKTPANIKKAYGLRKMKNKAVEKHNQIMEELEKELRKMKNLKSAQTVKVHSPPSPRQKNNINRLLSEIKRNSPSPSPSPNRTTPKKKTYSPSPLSASHVYPAVAGLKAKSKKKVQWWNQV
jgi:translation elongation factor EF-1beta